MRRYGIGLVLGLAWITSAAADPPVQSPPCWHGWWQHSKACPPIGCCPDDYHRKPFPLITSIPCGGGPDDYCRKPFPVIAPVKYCGRLDDYCRKPFPCLLCPPPSPYLQCGPAAGPCPAGAGH
jgi:hypothetical protein